jgi:hypothetical protein
VAALLDAGFAGKREDRDGEEGDERQERHEETQIHVAYPSVNMGDKRPSPRTVPERTRALRRSFVMLQSLTDLMERRLHVADRKIRADEVFFDPRDRRLRYLAVDIGGWFDIKEVIVAADLLVAPAEGRDHWSLRLDEAALEAAPRWGERGMDAPVDLTAWPPIIVGPFGGTYAPMLLYEQVVAQGRDAGQSEPPEEGSGDALVYRLERATEWLGTLAFGTDGELGRVEDILFDEATLTLARLVLGSGGLFSHRAGAVPVSAVRHMARQGTHLVLDISTAEVEQPPP